MAGTPEELRRHNKAALDDVQRKARDYAGRLAFTHAMSSITDREAKVPALANELSRLRSRGFAYRPDLETRLADVQGRAKSAHADVRAETERAGATWRARVDKLVSASGHLEAADPVGLAAPIAQLASEASAIDAGLDAIEARVGAIAKPFTEGYDAVERDLKEFNGVMDHFEGASFKLAVGEDAFQSAPVVWEDAPGGAKTGLLLLTNQRIRFEHKEEVVTKRTLLFFAAETQKIQKLLLDEPIGHLAASDDATRGWVMKDQLLTFSWAPTAKVRKTTFKLTGDYAKDLDTLVESLRAGEPDRQRVAGMAAAAGPKNIPTKCKECGGVLPAPVKGQLMLACTYCGTQHELA
jgi:hypothetical protein